MQIHLISSSLPITGSKTPWWASSVKSFVNFFKFSPGGTASGFTQGGGGPWPWPFVL